MTVKELKNYLKEFKDSDLVAVGMWKSSGQFYFMPHKPCCKPVTFKPDFANVSRVAVVGFFDDCIAHMVEKSEEVPS